MNAVYQRPRILKRTHTVLIVEPTSSFLPTNWRNRPETYRVINRFTFDRLGQADTKRFIFNRVAIDQNSANKRWAVTGGAA